MDKKQLRLEKSRNRAEAEALRRFPDLGDESWADQKNRRRRSAFVLGAMWYRATSGEEAS